MPSEIVMPRLGWTMEVGRVVEWLKADGDEVAEGDLILAIESDKAVTEVEALDSGILRIPPDPQIGVELPVGAPLGLIVAPGEEVSFGDAPAGSPPAAGAHAAPSTAPAADDRAALSVLSPNGASSNGAAHPTPAISPRARRLATASGIDWSTLAGSGSSGRIREADVRAALTSVPKAPAVPRATPDVRRLAAEAGVDLAALTPSRPGGRLTRADVLAASAAPSAVARASAAAEGAAEPLSPIRRVILQRMTEAARTVAPVTLTTDADASELVRLRVTLKAEAGDGVAVPSYTDLIARLVALALTEHPEMNASLSGSDDALSIVRHAAVHLGIAVDTDRGLLVPVVRDADRKSAFAIAAETGDLIARTRAGTAPADALGGSTFTVTNLGMFDVDAFTPIINLPEAAILGLGRIVAKPVVVDEETEEVAVRRMMALSLTFDHRVVDGAPAARFLQTVRRKIERPTTWLMR